MLLVGPNIFMSYSDCLVFDLQWTPDLRKIEVPSGFLKTEWIQTGSYLIQ
jgi:hypothetical protein